VDSRELAQKGRACCRRFCIWGFESPSLQNSDLSCYILTVSQGICPVDGCDSTASPDQLVSQTWRVRTSRTKIPSNLRAFYAFPASLLVSEETATFSENLPNKFLQPRPQKFQFLRRGLAEDGVRSHCAGVVEMVAVNPSVRNTPPLKAKLAQRGSSVISGSWKLASRYDCSGVSRAPSVASSSTTRKRFG